MFRVFFREKTLKSLNRVLAPVDKKRTLKKLEELAINPFAPGFDIKKLANFENLEKAYRLRVGNVRIIYELEMKEKIIIVYKIDYRRTTTYS